eukprot:15365439-Ditylum_brightwellii.AAC.1
MGIIFQHTIDKNKRWHDDQEPQHQRINKGALNTKEIVQSLKFQQFFKSATVTLNTSRIFLQPYIPDKMDDIIFTNKMPEPEYIDPNIPSLYGMPAFEDMAGLCAKVLFANKSLEPNMDSDMSGNCVWCYVKKIRESLKLHRFRWMFPMNCQKKNSYSAMKLATH